jgi:hypothetical protein
MCVFSENISFDSILFLTTLSMKQYKYVKVWRLISSSECVGFIYPISVVTGVRRQELDLSIWPSWVDFT